MEGSKEGAAIDQHLSTSMFPSQTADDRGPVVSENEAARLEAVRRYAILDTPPEGAFDRITRLAAQLFDVPIAIVSIIDHDRIWIKSAHGLEGVPEIPREPGLCSTAIEQNVPYVLENAANDARSMQNSLVSGAFGLRFYVGIPLGTSDGYNLGTLCVLDREPQAADPSKIEMLGTLAKIVVDELELRLAARCVTAEASRERTARDAGSVAPRNHTDALTGLRSRFALERELEDLHAEYRRRNGHAGGIAMVEADGLEDVNKSRGYDVGDKFLRSFAFALVCTFPDHQVFRASGNRFVVLSTSHVYEAALERAMRRALQAVREDGFPEAHVTFATASLSDVDGSPGELLQLADSRLYAAKAARR
jgi:diguanylate cyclase (GGDEF)-like protein